MTTSEPLTREEMAVVGTEQVRWLATRFHRLPAGIDREDLESVGNEAVLEAILTFDPNRGHAFATHVRTVARSRMQNAIAAARRRAKNRVALQGETRDGDPLPMPADRHADDPAAVASAREELKEALAVVAPKKTRVTAKQLEVAMPAPTAVADKAAELREVMFGAVRTEDVRQAMAALGTKAAAGDLKAITVLIGLIAPKASTVQQAVVVTNGGGA